MVCRTKIAVTSSLFNAADFNADDFEAVYAEIRVHDLRAGMNGIRVEIQVNDILRNRWSVMTHSLCGHYCVVSTLDDRGRQLI